MDEFSTDIEERKKVIQWAARAIQDASRLPLSIDSSNIEILQVGLSSCDNSRGNPMVNSVSLERTEMIQTAKAAGAVVIAGASGKDSLPETMEEKMENIEQLIKKLTAAGFEYPDIFLDPLVFPVSVKPENGVIILTCIKKLREKYGTDIHFAPGLSNISFGLPNRKLINQVFTYLCVENGLDGGIVDPVQINGTILNNTDPNSESFQIAKALLAGDDQFGMNYITASREGKI